MLGENEAQVYDRHSTMSYHDPTVSYHRYEALILPNLTADEENAGQMSLFMNPSSGFGCDGNRFTFSLTKDSSE